MQVLETVVDNRPCPVVRFLREGGEENSAPLACQDSLDEAQIIAKAKVLLLHAATACGGWSGRAEHTVTTNP